MHYKSDSRGITIIELVMAISLLSILLLSAYFFLFFTTKTLNNVEAEFVAGQEARMAVMKMEEEIRKAQAVKIDGVDYKAVSIQDSGMTLSIYTDIDNTGTIKLIQYKLDDEQLKRGVADLGSSPSSWTIVANTVKNKKLSPAKPIFSINIKTVLINLIIYDENSNLTNETTSVRTSITVRSKGAMD